VGLLIGLVNHDKMVALTQLGAFAEITAALSCAQLFHQNINTFPLHAGDEKERGKEGITEQNVTFIQGLFNGAQQCLLISAFAIKSSNSGIQ
jgi:hypothetical protein